MTTLAHVLSPAVTGVADELRALIKTGVLHVDDRGILRLTKHWWTNVDLLLLEDMHNHWGLRADPNGKCGVEDKVRKLLMEKWCRNSSGWVMKEDPGDVVFDLEEFDSWREVFEEKQEEDFNDFEGIGRFGI